MFKFSKTRIPSQVFLLHGQVLTAQIFNLGTKALHFPVYFISLRPHSLVLSTSASEVVWASIDHTWCNFYLHLPLHFPEMRRGTMVGNQQCLPNGLSALASQLHSRVSNYSSFKLLSEYEFFTQEAFSLLIILGLTLEHASSKQLYLEGKYWCNF